MQQLGLRRMHNNIDEARDHEQLSCTNLATIQIPKKLEVT
jgi:hypothetical protein